MNKCLYQMMCYLEVQKIKLQWTGSDSEAGNKISICKSDHKLNTRTSIMINNQMG